MRSVPIIYFTWIKHEESKTVSHITNCCFNWLYFYCFHWVLIYKRSRHCVKKIRCWHDVDDCKQSINPPSISSNTNKACWPSKKLARKLFIFYLRCNLNLLKFGKMVILVLLECLQEKKLLVVSTVLYSIHDGTD